MEIAILFPHFIKLTALAVEDFKECSNTDISNACTKSTTYIIHDVTTTITQLFLHQKMFTS